jgi:hypothetical protein
MRRTYVEEISQNEIRLILRELHNTLREPLVNKYALPTSDSYSHVSIYFNSTKLSNDLRFVRITG